MKTKKKRHEQKFPLLTIILPALFFAATAFLYLHNLTRDIYSGDIGDLVTASYVFGVPHPPGYPLFTFLGFLFSHSSLPLPPVSKVALISTIASLIGLFFYHKFAFRATQSLFLSLLSTSILAFSYLFWLHAEIPEVFGLNNLFVIIIIYYAILFYQEKKERYLYLVVFFTSLSLTHHHTILFVLPAAFLLTVRHIKFIFSSKKRLLFLIFLFLLGILPYLYVPIAASRNPVINWDNASNLKNFIHLIQRKDYGSGFAPSINSGVPLTIRMTLIKNYAEALLSIYSYQILFVFFLGILKLFKIDRLLFISLLCALLLSGVFFIYYGATYYTTAVSIGIIERFYTLSSVVFMFFIPYGFLIIKKFLDSKFSYKIYSLVILSYFLIIPFYLLKYNFSKTDMSKTTIGQTLAYDVLSPLPKNAVLFLSGDTTTFNIWYSRYVLGVRKDVGIINPPGVGGNQYLDEELNKYYQKNPHLKLSEVMSKTLDDILKRRRVFSSYKITQVPLPKDTQLVAKGLVFEIMHKKDIPEEHRYLDGVEEILRKMHVVRRNLLTPAEQNLIASEIPTIYSNALVRVGDFIDSYFKNPTKSEHYYRRALLIDDSNPAAYSGLSLSLYKSYNDCDQSIKNIKQAISLYPIWSQYYRQLYKIFKECNVDKNQIEKIKHEYRSKFRENIE